MNIVHIDDVSDENINHTTAFQAVNFFKNFFIIIINN